MAGGCAARAAAGPFIPVAGCKTGRLFRQAARLPWGGAYCLSDAMSITNRYFTSLFSIRS
ncbi:Uncharacterised protein [Burkholderia cenocepacia]|nr:Uncharacterised protein [Burkholderia cenocepacia]